MAVIKCLPGTKDLKDMLLYLENEGKTSDELRSGINCTADNVETEFNIIKELYNKLKGKQYYHITQAFSPEDNIEPSKAHDIGVKWIGENIEDYQIYVVTHIDRNHIHNHFVVNSVNLESGLKLQISPKKLENLKKSSNEICVLEGLSTINLSKGYGISVSDREYRLEKSGIKTHKRTLREYIDKSLIHSENILEFVSILKDNFNVEVEMNNSSIVYRMLENGFVIRGSKLGGSYSKSGILEYLNLKV